MTDTDKIQQIFENAGATVVGAVVMWALSGVRVERAALRAAMEAIGLGDAVPKDPRPEKLLAKAVRAQHLGRKRIFFRRLAKGSFALVEEADQGDQLEHRHTLTIDLEDLDVGGERRKVARAMRPAADSPEPNDDAVAVAAAVVNAYSDAARYANTEDLSEMLVLAMQGTQTNPILAAVNLRPGTGGVYFVPGPQVERVLALKALVDTYGGSHVTVLTLYGDATNLTEAAAAAKASFQARLNELRGELKDFAAEMRAKGTEMTDRHMETRVRRLGSLRDRVDMWTDALGGVQNELRAEIALAQAEVAREMGLEA